MKCFFKILALIGVLAGGILLVDYKTNSVMAGKNTTIIDKMSSKMQDMFAR